MQQYQLLTPDEHQTTNKKRRRTGCLAFPGALIFLLIIAYYLVRPGVFTIQPIGALPEGVTVIYHSRSNIMPFFSSLDGLCLQIQGSVNLLCRMAAMSAATDIADKTLIRLPYSRWAYLQSTGGLEFKN